ncbi:MAG: DUF427 domain-containing protein [Chloroflexota bacterium]
MKAIYNGVVVAESKNTVIVEGNHYFPIDSVKMEYLSESDRQTICPWKGTASYYNIATDQGNSSSNAAWYYPDPKSAAENIKDHVAFYPVVQVTA